MDEPSERRHSQWQIVHHLSEEIFSYLKRQGIRRHEATLLIGDLMESLGYHIAERIPE